MMDRRFVFGLFEVSVWRGRGIHFWSRGHQRRQRCEADRVGDQQIIKRLALSIRRFRRKMLMRLPFRERFAREWFKAGGCGTAVRGSTRSKIVTR
jgi:hypothetical protein